MALPTTGALSISQIKSELNSNINSLAELSKLAYENTSNTKFLPPHKISDFYGYTHVIPVKTKSVQANYTDFRESNGTYRIIAHRSGDFSQALTVYYTLTYTSNTNSSNQIAYDSFEFKAGQNDIQYSSEIIKYVYSAKSIEALTITGTNPTGYTF